MAAGKCSVDQLSAVGVPLVHRDLVAIFHGLDDPVDVREIEPRIDTLRVHVQRDRHETAIAGPLAISKQATFDPISARHQAEFRRGHAGAAIVMRMQRDDRRFAIGQVPGEILDLVGVDVGRRRLDRGGEVEDDRRIARRLQDIHHRGANLDAEIEFCGRERLRRVFELPMGVGAFRCLIPQDPGTVDGDLPDLVARHAEHDVAPRGRNSVVEVDNCGPGAFEAFEAGADQVFARLGEHLHRNIVGHRAGADEVLDEIELCRACTRETDLDFLHANLHQQFEETRLLHRIHRVDDRLVAVPQIGGKPAGRRRDRAARPLAVRQVDLREGPVLAARFGQHGHGKTVSTKGLGRLRQSLGRGWRRSRPSAASRPRACKSQKQVEPFGHAGFYGQPLRACKGKAQPPMRVTKFHRQGELGWPTKRQR